MNSCKFLLIFVGFCFFSYEKQVFFSHFLYICRRFMANKKKIVFILNPISGTHSKKEIPEIIERTLDHDQFDAEIKLTEYAGHDIVVAIGGDGTVNEVARSLVHTQTALGIIPCGSGNGLARHLCLPLDIKKAIQIINACKIEAFDYGVINDLPFFCTCGMGFDAFISLKFAEAGKRGPVTYLENVLKEGLVYRPETYEVEDEGATMQDGELDVIVMEPFNALDAPQVAADLFMKTLTNNSKIKTFRTKRLHITRQEPGAIHYDGDPIMTGKDIDVHIEPQGIRILTNPEKKEDTDGANFLLNAFSDFFNNINNVREDIEKTGHRMLIINKVMLRKLSKL